jgi:hypothetical protein
MLEGVMTKSIIERLEEIDPGPIEIHWRADGDDPELVGYALVELTGKNTYNWYFVIENGVQFPLPNADGDQTCFLGIDAPTTPAAFYTWVLNEGTLGANPQTIQAQEQLSDWNP